MCVCALVCAMLVLTAIAMAMDDSVTVSMGDEMRGVFRVIFFVNADVRSYNEVHLESNTSPYNLIVSLKHNF